MEYILFFTLFTVLKAFKTESSKYILGFGHSFNNSANFTFPYCAILKRSKFNEINSVIFGCYLLRFCESVSLDKYY